eukprot:GILK01014857.1.p1 GENE.GILK01014857.1~~GILK01014857.1.p1  ORF type:complete len:468 (+),score=25.87 GILK01014857.1:126-1406(+)
MAAGSIGMATSLALIGCLLGIMVTGAAKVAFYPYSLLHTTGGHKNATSDLDVQSKPPGGFIRWLSPRGTYEPSASRLAYYSIYLFTVPDKKFFASYPYIMSMVLSIVLNVARDQLACSARWAILAAWFALIGIVIGVAQPHRARCLSHLSSASYGLLSLVCVMGVVEGTSSPSRSVSTVKLSFVFLLLLLSIARVVYNGLSMYYERTTRRQLLAIVNEADNTPNEASAAYRQDKGCDIDDVVSAAESDCEVKMRQPGYRVEHIDLAEAVEVEPLPKVPADMYDDADCGLMIEEAPKGASNGSADLTGNNGASASSGPMAVPSHSATIDDCPVDTLGPEPPNQQQSDSDEERRLEDIGEDDFSSTVATVGGKDARDNGSYSDLDEFFGVGDGPRPQADEFDDEVDKDVAVVHVTDVPVPYDDEQDLF